jgi:hypothetical protein
VQEAAAAGDGYAMLALAQQLVDGRFVEQNYAQANSPGTLQNPPRPSTLLTGPCGQRCPSAEQRPEG